MTSSARPNAVEAPVPLVTVTAVLECALPS